MAARTATRGLRTDCYQPLEANYQLTRRCLEVCLEFRNPVAVITKGALVQRDVDLLAQLAAVGCASVYLSIPFADNATARAVEPYASSIDRRFEALRVLSDGGVPTGVAVAPIIPGLNDAHIPEILERAHAAGARRAFRMMVRLSAEVRPVFVERIAEAFPLRHEKILCAIRDVRGGRLNRTGFGERMRGTGARWAAIEQLFDTHCRRLGLETGPVDDGSPSPFRRPEAQQALF